jgi:hypothetical protein
LGWAAIASVWPAIVRVRAAAFVGGPESSIAGTGIFFPRPVFIDPGSAVAVLRSLAASVGPDNASDRAVNIPVGPADTPTGAAGVRAWSVGAMGRAADLITRSHSAWRRAT